MQLFIAVLEYLYSLLYLFLYGSSCIKDGSQFVLEIVDERCIVVAYLFYHEIEGIICIFQIQFFVSYICKCLKTEYFDVFCLGRHLLDSLYFMKVTVDKGVALMQVALVEQLAFFFVCLVLVYLLKTFGMYA